MVRLSRAELHDLVWSKPMTEIARQFGVRDQHIARACDDADIARPRAGHLQEIEHGKFVPRAMGSRNIVNLLLKLGRTKNCGLLPLSWRFAKF